MDQDTSVRFHVLGPLLVTAGRRRVGLRGPRQEKILAVLLLNANRTVSIDGLAEAVWGDRIPATGRRQVQDSVSLLRRLFHRPGRLADLLFTERGGYRLEVGADQFDAMEFERLVRAVGDGDDAGAAGSLRRALTLWRGPVLAGLDVPALRPSIAAWDERRMAVWEECLALEMAEGGPVPGHVIGELGHLIAVEPYRERPVELLMIALHRQGRTSEALEMFRRFRARLAADAGLEPGALLTSTHERILRGGTATSSTLVNGAVGPAERWPGPIRPAQLPAALRAFVGRVEALDELDAAGTESGVAVITGMAGVGKTSLAVQWAHRRRSLFPDGQIFLDLHGFDEVEPVTVERALHRVLQALGAPADRIPRDPDEAAALYRSLLDGCRMLVVLDNAAHLRQVQALLPGGHGCFTVITSRSAMPDLIARHCARLVRLGILARTEAVRLLRARLGPDRRHAAEADLAALVDRCAGSPFALASAAARLVVDAGLTPAALAEQLGGVRNPTPDAGDAGEGLRVVSS